MISFLRVHISDACQETINHQIFNPRKYVIIKRNFELWESLIQKDLKLAEGKLITFFESFIVLGKLLEAIIGEMNKFIFII